MRSCRSNSANGSSSLVKSVLKNGFMLCPDAVAFGAAAFGAAAFGAAVFGAATDASTVGTATGAVHVWSFGRSPRALLALEGSEMVDKKPKREKWRAAPKVRGRFPKTQGFSNSKGFGGR